MRTLTINGLLLASLALHTTPLLAEAKQPTKEPWQLAEETEVWTPVPVAVATPENAPPSDALVLFDGKSLDQWQAAEGGAPKWSVHDGSFTVVPKTGDIKTKESFCDIQLHLEWLMPTKVTDDKGKELLSQERNNSGVFLQERYEIQVLDSYQSRTYSNGQAGAVYKQTIPLVNASRAPGQWQSYDIIYSAPKFDATAKLVAPGRVTVLHNGVLVQNNTEILGKTEWIGKPKYTAHECAPLRLQDHGGPVTYRNIWVRKL